MVDADPGLFGGHVLHAMARLGPGSRPTPYEPRSRDAILDGPGRARKQA
ncbi:MULTISPECIES: hypothetical protein [unclassified Streptomyces]